MLKTRDERKDDLLTAEKEDVEDGDSQVDGESEVCE